MIGWWLMIRKLIKRFLIFEFNIEELNGTNEKWTRCNVIIKIHTYHTNIIDFLL